MAGFRFVKPLIGFSITLAALYSCRQNSREQPREFFTIESEGKKLRVEVVTDSILKPFGMDFLPDGTLLVTDRTVGKLIRLDVQTGKKTQIKGLPKLLGQVDGGMLDILVHPDYETNG